MRHHLKFCWPARAAVFWFLLTLCRPVLADDQISADEYSIKAAFVYNLARFVDWPPKKFEREDAPLVIGVAGDEFFEKIAAVVKHKRIGPHRVTVRRVSTPSETRDCHILFVTRSKNGPAVEILKAASAAAVLTFGETSDFLEDGGMIRFFLESDNIRLEINDDAIRRAGVGIQSAALSTLVNKKIARLRRV